MFEGDVHIKHFDCPHDQFMLTWVNDTLVFAVDYIDLEWMELPFTFHLVKLILA